MSLLCFLWVLVYTRCFGWVFMILSLVYDVSSFASGDCWWLCLVGLVVA